MSLLNPAINLNLRHQLESSLNMQNSGLSMDHTKQIGPDDNHIFMPPFLQPSFYGCENTLFLLCFQTH